MQKSKHERTVDILNIALGLILFISPWAFGFASDRLAAWNAWVCAVVLIGIAATTLLSFAEWEDWVELVLGFWIVLSPWLIGYADTGPAHTAHMFVGLGVIGLSLWDLWLVHESRTKTPTP